MGDGPPYAGRTSRGDILFVMSEYQYYEFAAVDQPLSARQVAELRAISTRAEITETSFINEYHWGDLKADPHRLVARYFDVHMYYANWGTRRVIWRLPLNAVDRAPLAAYDAFDTPGITVTRRHLVIDVRVDAEAGWDEPESANGWMAMATGLRGDLMMGDMRLLYLSWLLGVQNGELDPRTLEPPVPAGLRKLSGALVRFVDFLLLERQLLNAAGKASAALPVESALRRRTRLRQWIMRLDVKAKDALLMRLVDQSEIAARAELLRQFHASQAPHSPRTSMGEHRRTVGELQEALGHERP